MSTLTEEQVAVMTMEEMYLTCQLCTSWSVFCVEPPTVSYVDINDMVEKASKEDPIKGVVIVATMAGKSRSGYQCPVFSARMKMDRRIIDGIKKVMQGEE